MLLTTHVYKNTTHYTCGHQRDTEFDGKESLIVVKGITVHCKATADSIREMAVHMKEIDSKESMIDSKETLGTYHQSMSSSLGT